MHRAVPLLLAGLLVLGAASFADATARGDAARAAHHAEVEAAKAPAASDAAAQAARASLFGRFTLEGSHARGSFASLDITPGGVVNGLAVGNVTYADTITTDATGAFDLLQQAGATLHLDSDALEITAHDDPTGALDYRTEESAVTVTFTLSSGIAAITSADQIILTPATGAHAHLVPAGPAKLALSTDGKTVTATLSPRAGVMFIAHPSDATLATASLHALKDAYSSKRLGAIASFYRNGSTLAGERAYFGIDVSPTSSNATSLTLQLTSYEDVSKAIAIRLAPGFFTSPGAVHAVLDGRTVPLGGSDRSLLSGSTTDSVVTNDTGAGTIVLVNLAHTTDHTLTLTTDAVGAAPTPAESTSSGATPARGIPAPGIIVVALVAAGVALAVRRR